MKTIITTSILALCFATSGVAQTDFSLSGLGRAIVSNESLSGDILQGDSLSSKRGNGGYTLFDLGMNVKNNHFEALTILRVRNEFGLFYGAGASFNFRQISLKGDINENISYSFGDIDLKRSPYTLRNIDYQYDRFQSNLFAQRKNIQDYENFVLNNQWRMQGAEVAGEHKIGEHDLLTELAVVRTNSTNELNVADRIFTANRIGVETKSLNLFINHTGFLDIGIEEYDVKFNNQVLTLQGKYELPLKSTPTSISFESGFSDYSYTDNLGDTTAQNNDFFYEVNAESKPIKVLKAIQIGYRDVGPQFVSPGAQSRRINSNASPLLFASVNNSTIARAMGLYDRVTGEAIYNRSLSITLQDFIPAYGNALPYGKATPNRRGISYSVETDTSLPFITASLEGSFLSEVTPDRVQDGELRKFMIVQGGFDLHIDKLMDSKKKLTVRVGAQSENTSREGVGPIDLSVVTIDAGLSAELLKDIHLLAGYKSLSSIGNEFLSQRDQFNGLLSANPQALSYDLTQNILAFGLRVAINDRSQFSANYYNWSIKDKTAANQSYSVGQFFLNYTIQF